MGILSLDPPPITPNHALLILWATLPLPSPFLSPIVWHLEAITMPTTTSFMEFSHSCSMQCYRINSKCLPKKDSVCCFTIGSVELIWLYYFVFEEEPFYPRLALNLLCNRRCSWSPNPPVSTSLCWDFRCTPSHTGFYLDLGTKLRFGAC